MASLATGTGRPGRPVRRRFTRGAGMLTGALSSPLRGVEPSQSRVPATRTPCHRSQTLSAPRSRGAVIAGRVRAHPAQAHPWLWGEA